MKYSPTKLPLRVLLVLVSLCPLTGSAQSKDDWLRVVTGEEEIIDVDRTSISFTPNSLTYSAVFRTTLTAPADVPSKRTVKYLTRLDTIEFGKGHRVIASRFLDAKNVEVHTIDHGPDAVWNSASGRSSRAIYSAVRQLSPFGNWKVADYRFATGGKGSTADEKDLRSLIGSRVRFGVDKIAVGDENCGVNSFEGRTVSNADAKTYFDTSLAAIGIHGDEINAVRFNCTISNTRTQRSFLMRIGRDRAAMLWDGVFLDLRRIPTAFTP
ncbi:MAG: hypothetical protein ABL984_21675 [Pyrinomonadaceae bacterium]